MFGHQDDHKDDEQSSKEEVVITPDAPATDTATDTAATDQTATDDTAPASDTTTDTSNDTSSDDTPADTAPTTDTASAPEVSSEDTNTWQHPGAPLSDDKPAEAKEEPKDEVPEETASNGPEPIKDIVGSSAGPDFKPFPQKDDDDKFEDIATPHALIDIKQKALSDLTPLVGQLDQPPEDKFRTIMMMIQASDDQALVQTAYEAAHEIKEEKLRAQALLDIVNEINYFTQHPEN